MSEFLRDYLTVAIFAAVTIGLLGAVLSVGKLVRPERAQAENEELRPLAELDDGARATIVRLAEHDGDLLHWFYDQGFEPGRELRLTAADPAAGSFRVQLNGREETVAEKAAAGLFVRPS